jgi:hypothetical protein
VYLIHQYFDFLISQIHDEAKKFSYQTGVKVVVAYGGAPITQQVICHCMECFYVHFFFCCYDFEFWLGTENFKQTSCYFQQFNK